MKNNLFITILLVLLTTGCEPEELAIIGPRTYSAGWKSGSIDFEIESNTDWVITSAAGWISVSPSSGNGNSSVTVDYMENPDNQIRETTLEIIGSGVDNPDFITISQEKRPLLIADISWTLKAEMPIARSFLPPSASVVNDKIYIIGGTSVNGPVSSVDQYDPATDTWTSKAPMLEARWGHSADVVDGKIYVMGGCLTTYGDAIQSMEVYDPVTDEWQPLGNMPTARLGFGSCVIDGKIYVTGGRTADPGGDYLDIVQVYDPSAKSWKNLSSMPGEKGYHSSSARDSYIYAISGTKSGLSGAGEDLVYKYDIGTNTWTETTPMNKGRWSLSTCTVDSLILCIGGYLSGTDSGQKTVEIITNKEDQIIEGTVMNNYRAGFSTCFCKGKIYVFGGTTAAPPAYGASRTVEEGVITVRN